MVDLMKSEKNFLERLADAVPGLKGYRARDDARETDQRLREYLAVRLESVNRGLDDAKKSALSGGGGLASMSAFDGLDARLATVTGKLRHGRQGYSGVFDQVKIKEAELAHLYELDTGLIGLVDQLDHGVKTGQPELIRTALAALEQQVEARRTIFDLPSA